MGRPRSRRDIIGEEPPDDLYPADSPILARAEFDSVAMDALAMPGITNEHQERIKDWARKLVREGMSREDVELRICREVIVAVTSLKAPDAVDPTSFARAQAIINSRAGGKRQARRNGDIKLWAEQCRAVARKHDLSVKEVLNQAWRENSILVARARAPEKVGFRLTYFAGLPALFGRKKMSLPQKKRFLRRLSVALEELSLT
jgi:hypothetical protein